MNRYELGGDLISTGETREFLLDEYNDTPHSLNSVIRKSGHR